MTTYEDELIDNQITLLLQKSDANFEKATEIAYDIKKSVKNLTSSMKEIHKASKIWVDFFDSFSTVSTSQLVNNSDILPVKPCIGDDSDPSFLAISPQYKNKQELPTYMVDIPFTPILPPKLNHKEISSNLKTPEATQPTIDIKNNSLLSSIDHDMSSLDISLLSDIPQYKPESDI
ncbi:hypothetical protein WA158_002406 [Blastocystis sp. Blastoise]